MADFESRVREAVGSGEPLAELRRVLTEELDRGTATRDLLAHLERMRPDLGEEQEDSVLVGMDWLSGWCSPGEHLPEG